MCIRDRAYTCLSSLLAVSPFCLFSGAPLGPFPFKAWGLIALLAFGATIIGQIVPIWAVRYVRPSTVSMLSLAGPLFSAVGCYWLLGEVPSAQVVCGGLVVLAGLAWYIAVSYTHLTFAISFPLLSKSLRRTKVPCFQS